MNTVGYLIAQEGLLEGLSLILEENTEWILGRDPDEAKIVLEDPVVSRKHVLFRLTEEGITAENLSSVNPTTVNGQEIAEAVLLQESDLLQIGSTLFRFSYTPQIEPFEDPFSSNDLSDINALSMPTSFESRWMIKVASGPNAGAEFYMAYGKSYIIGKDPEVCDILLQDLSVSRQHAKIFVDEDGKVFIEDLDSKNKTVVKGQPISNQLELHSQDFITLGTTTILVIDQELDLETVLSLHPHHAYPDKPKVDSLPSQELPQQVEPEKSWKEMTFSKKQLTLGITAAALILTLLICIISLFQEKQLPKPSKHEEDMVVEVIDKYPGIQFSYNLGSGKLFITGHVLSSIDKQELLYQLQGLSFISTIDDSAVVIDELVWENMNALLLTNPGWKGVSIFSRKPGQFIARGYLHNLEDSQSLTDYLNIHFPYLDQLDNQVVVESTLATQIQGLLLEKGFNNVTYQLTDGELILSGRINAKDAIEFDLLTDDFKEIIGIKSLKNYVAYTTESSSLVDLSEAYDVTGFSKKDGENHFVVISGKILTMGDFLDGMEITSIADSTIFLEKDGLKFKINYNLQ